MTRFDWLKQQLNIRTDYEVCWEWPYAKEKDGYGKCSVNNKHRKVHQLALELTGHIRPAPPNNQALHSCHNPPCFNPRHLRWGSNTENRRDQIKAGNQVVLTGEKNGRAKLTEQEVLDILERCKQGETQASVAKLFGVSSSIVSDIFNGKRWKSVTGL